MRWEGCDLRGCSIEGGERTSQKWGVRSGFEEAEGVFWGLLNFWDIFEDFWGWRCPALLPLRRQRQLWGSVVTPEERVARPAPVWSETRRTLEEDFSARWSSGLGRRGDFWEKNLWVPKFKVDWEGWVEGKWKFYHWNRMWCTNLFSVLDKAPVAKVLANKYESKSLNSLWLQ